MKQQKPVRRLALDGTQNTRDLGGYPCIGGTTRWRAFLRSDNPATLTKDDIIYLRSYGITDVVDLRREDEAQRSPSALQGAKGFAVHNISLNDELHHIDFEGDLPGSMAGLYITLLDKSQNQIAAVLQAMAAAKGGVLFHCAVGKDRTGVIAMLLLKLAGVPNPDVVADYAITDIYMREIFDAQQQVFRGHEIPQHVLQSRPVSMERLLRHMYTTYGSVYEYLQGIGLDIRTLEALQKRLIDPA